MQELMIDLNTLYSNKRTGINNPVVNGDPRTDFQRDYDRIIFSSAFRRLQNKTQVFPLPGSVFVHNRLTHSLEVSSVGRSLGNLIGEFIADKFDKQLNTESKLFYRYDLINVIAAACLCHDIGNPAFGHSGEDAIVCFFRNNESHLKPFFSDNEWCDLINFEGNANAIRVLTHQQKGKSEGGLMLTYSTLASIAKYPCESTGKDKSVLHRKKFGFFQSEKNTFTDIAESTGMIQQSDEPVTFLRHPFVWLVEAADDICYNIIDFEDAHRIGIVEHSNCIDLLLSLIESNEEESGKTTARLESISDKNEQVTFLRAKAINTLITKSKSIFEQNVESFINGTFNKPIFDCIKECNSELTDIIDFSREHIYNNRQVVEIENAGYNVINELLVHFIPPMLKNNRTNAEEKAIRLIPIAFNYDGASPYERVMGVLDYISGMTDNYITDLYRRIKGIDMGRVF